MHAFFRKSHAFWDGPTRICGITSLAISCALAETSTTNPNGSTTCLTICSSVWSFRTRFGRTAATLDFTNGDRVNPETGRNVEEGLPIIDGSLDTSLGNSVDIDLGFSEAVTAQILAYQMFTSNYSPRYLEQAKVWVLDSGSSPVLDGSFETIQFCDPNPSGAGACYAARAPVAGERPNLAAEWIQRGQVLEQQYEEAFEQGGENAARSIGFDIDNLIQDINIGIALDYYLGRTF